MSVMFSHTVLLETTLCHPLFCLFGCDNTFFRLFHENFAHFSCVFLEDFHIFPTFLRQIRTFFRIFVFRGGAGERRNGKRVTKSFSRAFFTEPIFDPILYQKDERSIDKRGGICYNFHERQRRFPLREVTFEERTTGVPAFAFCRRQTFFHFFAASAAERRRS